MTDNTRSRVREARFDEYQQIADVQRRNGLIPKNEDQWRHLWEANPAFLKHPNFPIGWVIESADGRVVGYMGHIPTISHLQGREVLTSNAHAMAIDPAFRGQAGYFVMRAISMRHAQVAITTSANPNSSKLLEPLKCKRVPAGDWKHSVFWITNHTGFLQSAFVRTRVPRSFAYPAAALLSAKDFWSDRELRRHSSNPALTFCDRFDDRFESFWNQLRCAYPNRFLSDRSLATLNWHFKFALMQKQVWILTVGNSQNITAYAVFYRHDNPERGLKRVRLVDFQTLDGDCTVLAPMLAWARQRCSDEGIHMLEAYGFRPEKERVIAALAPHRRELPSWFYYYRTRDKELTAALGSADAWDPCHFDGDSSI